MRNLTKLGLATLVLPGLTAATMPALTGTAHAAPAPLGAAAAEVLAAAPSTTISATADAHVLQEKATSSFPAAPKVKARSTTRHFTTYLKFTVPSSVVGSGQITSAKLQLAPVDAVTGTLHVRPVSDTTWQPSSLTYANAPETGASLGTVPTNVTTPVVDVTSAVGAAGTYSFAVTADTGATGSFSSAEGSTGAPTLQLSIDSAAVAAPCSTQIAGDPRCAGKMYYGASAEGGDPETLERTTGPTGVYRSYMGSTSPASKLASRAKTDVAAGRIPLISTKVPNDDWAGVAAGKHDAWLLERIKALAAVKGPVWLSLHHEPNGDGPAANWIKMQQHARKLIDANSANVALVGILNGWAFRQRNPIGTQWRHPVGTGVHIMGFDSYNGWTPTNGKTWASVEDVFGVPSREIQSWGYPTLVAEYGVRTDPKNPGKAAQWMRDAYNYALGNKFMAISYFNSGHNSTDGSWALTGERLTAFTDNLKKSTSARF